MICLAMILLFAVSYVATGDERWCAEKQNEPWSYGGQNGPKKWYKTYKDCKGRMQSPIYIVDDNTIKEWGEFPQFYGYEVPLKGNIINDGNTVRITPTDRVKRAVVVEGTNFTLEEMHFHFSADKWRGSEHIRDGKKFAMEMHLVHRSEDRRTAVFAVLFQKAIYNVDIKAMVKAVSTVKYEGNEVEILKGINLYDILPRCKTTFYRYRGSLTAPPCTEGVIWTVFKYPNIISEQQLETFLKQRSTSENTPKDSECFLEGNIRPMQRLHDRKIKLYNSECEVIYD